MSSRLYPAAIILSVVLGTSSGMLLASCTSSRSDAGFASASGVADAYVPPPAYVIAAYVRPSSRLDLAAVDARRLTHIYYAFADVQDEELVLRREDDPENLRKLTALRSINPDLKVLLSVGGWSWSGGFSDAALTDSSRAHFARSAVRMVEEHGLDGIDLDWEYPGMPGAGNTHREEDRENFTMLLGAVRKHLDDLAARRGRSEGYLLTIAAGVGEGYLRNTEMGRVAEHLDVVNLMTYDFAGSWTDRTGHHTNLHPSGCGSISASEAVDRFIAEGVPQEKIVIGAAFYGRSWTGVDLSGTGLCRPYEGESGAHSFSQLREIAATHGYVRRWDADALAPYLVQPDSARFITYDDEASVQFKALFIREQNLAGVMFWAYDHDPDATLLGVLHSYLSVPPGP